MGQRVFLAILKPIPKESPRNCEGLSKIASQPLLEEIPEQLVVHIVMELNLRSLDDRTQQPRAPVRRSLLQIGIPGLNILTEQRRRPV